ncbi:ADP-ribosylglycohydrolase family protein [Dictyobacter kobayashii]|uniref:Hydrolase n=1 Tax=Dictyobacter kobayashii TaxID=2014872 RepID=A0A402AQK9_9CHLR|nr:ADP-ribosylglycohydrolase family protein [Dictyobacter kobayashii]GCE21310.1 hypothetical protein KDK_51100 [Dictyobacter kobayashii]
MEHTGQHEARLARALVALEGLAVGDAFGDQFFKQREQAAERLANRTLLESPWPYTDDTQMALSLVSILRQYGSIQQDQLAASFAEHYEGSRAYGPSMHYLLRAIRAGNPWREATAQQFAGQGSFGNGAAMRIAPLGAYFADDLQAVIEQATLAAEVTHTHPEAIAGSIAVALATAYAWQLRQSGRLPERPEFLDLILPHIPTSEVRRKIRWARDFSADIALDAVVNQLGNGSKISSQDTVPFVLWCAGESLNDYQEALWLTASALGDVDTTCAMVGGIVATYTGPTAIPTAWLQAREPLPTWHLAPRKSNNKRELYVRGLSPLNLFLHEKSNNKRELYVRGLSPLNLFLHEKSNNKRELYVRGLSLLNLFCMKRGNNNSLRQIK